jgi:hypothetical protein
VRLRAMIAKVCVGSWRDSSRERTRYPRVFLAGAELLPPQNKANSKRSSFQLPGHID